MRAAEGEPVPCERLKLEMTDAGRGLLSARIGERMTLEAADAALERLVAHAAEPERAARLGLREILVYGSLMRRDPFPADVDAVLVCDAAPEDGFLPADLVRDALGAERDPALRDVHIARAHVPWTDMIRVWRDGLRIDPPEPVPADPAVAAAESARVPGRSVPELDDPDDLVTGGPAGDDHAPPFP
ncbi:MAG: hypothetical protein DI629_21080 [Mesorhizobium amorphae]|nr:MAG: hypothetical protein DI629_21080 [Mesorhizobium amorphae]